MLFIIMAVLGVLIWASEAYIEYEKTQAKDGMITIVVDQRWSRTFDDYYESRTVKVDGLTCEVIPVENPFIQY